jgi:hypothetical protein
MHLSATPLEPLDWGRFAGLNAGLGLSAWFAVRLLAAATDWRTAALLMLLAGFAAFITFVPLWTALSLVPRLGIGKTSLLTVALQPAALIWTGATMTYSGHHFYALYLVLLLPAASMLALEIQEQRAKRAARAEAPHTAPAVSES